MSFKIPFIMPETIPDKPVVYSYDARSILMPPARSYEIGYWLQSEIFKFCDQFPHVKHDISRYLAFYAPDEADRLGMSLETIDAIIDRFNHSQYEAVDPDANSVIFYACYAIMC